MPTLMHNDRSDMVKRVRTTLVDDIDGTEITEGGRSIDFSYRGVNYTIDLNAENARRFDEDMARYRGSATRVRGRTAKTR